MTAGLRSSTHADGRIIRSFPVIRLVIRLAWSLVAVFDSTSFPGSSPTRLWEQGCSWSSLRDVRQPEVDYLHSWPVVLPIELLAKRLRKKKTPGKTNLVRPRHIFRKKTTYVALKRLSAVACKQALPWSWGVGEGRGEGLQVTPPFSPCRQNARERCLAGYCAVTPRTKPEKGPIHIISSF